MLSINEKINKRVKNLNGLSRFIDEWIDYVKTAPWADGECLFDNLRYENAISWPVYFIHYETTSVDEFKVESHTLWNEEDKKPDINYLKRVAEIFHIEEDELFGQIMKLPNDFHEKFYRGHRQENNGEPILHEIYQRLLNATLSRVYRTEIEHRKKNSLDLDYGIMICLRVNNLFSNKPVEIHFENYVHAMETYGLDMECHSFEQMGIKFENYDVRFENGTVHRPDEPSRKYYCKTKFNECLEILKEEAQKKTQDLFRNQENEKREEIAYEETVQDECTNKWLNHLQYPTNSVKIDL